MRPDLESRVEELLRQSLAAWRVEGEVARDVDGRLVLAAAGRRLRVARAEPGLPFRWMVEDGGRSRGVTSIVGLLRSVRVAVDPGYRPARVRFGPTPLVSS